MKNITKYNNNNNFILNLAHIGYFNYLLYTYAFINSYYKNKTQNNEYLLLILLLQILLPID